MFQEQQKKPNAEPTTGTSTTTTGRTFSAMKLRLPFGRASGAAAKKVSVGRVRPPRPVRIGSLKRTKTTKL